MMMVKHNYEIFVDNMRLFYMLYNNVAFIANVVVSRILIPSTFSQISDIQICAMIQQRLRAIFLALWF